METPVWPSLALTARSARHNTWFGLMAGPMQAYSLMDRTARQALWMEGWLENPKQ